MVRSHSTVRDGIYCSLSCDLVIVVYANTATFVARIRVTCFVLLGTCGDFASVCTYLWNRYATGIFEYVNTESENYQRCSNIFLKVSPPVINDCQREFFVKNE